MELVRMARPPSHQAVLPHSPSTTAGPRGQQALRRHSSRRTLAISDQLQHRERHWLACNGGIIYLNSYLPLSSLLIKSATQTKLDA
jgi:hypothetical protein